MANSYAGPLALLAILVSIFLLLVRPKPAHKRLPGPPRLPLVGNLLQIPQTRPWIQMAEWTKLYGPIYRLRLGFTDLVVLGSPKVAVELLERRSAKYSCRPRHIMTSEHVSRGLRLTFMPYNELWKKQRKLLHLLTQPQSAGMYEPIQLQESLQLCLDLIDSPDQHWEHALRYAGSTVLQIAYNRRALRFTDENITQMKTCNSNLIKTAVPGRYWVDSLPILNYFPHWACKWKQEASHIFNETFKLFSHLYDGAMNLDLNTGDHGRDRVGDCFVRRIDSLKDEYGLSREEAIFMAGAMYGPGSDTTAAAIETLIFTCAVHRDKILLAQDELDRVVGRDRLPGFEDQAHLVYCNALIREVLRWRTVIPGGLAHRTTQDDFYEGYFIPKGTSVVANHWSLHFDPETYTDPENFQPERFIDPLNGRLQGTRWSERGHHAFGFGRRACPGIHIAERSLFITFTRILWSCTIRSNGSIDENNFSTGFSSYPLPFPVEICARGDFVRSLLEKEMENIGSESLTITFKDSN